jgi:hypothetical protein
MSNFYLGVDPGGQGALALIDPDGKAVEWDKMGSILDIDDFIYNAVIMSQGKLVCCFEEHKGGGPQCNANTHRSAGYYLGIFKTMCHLHHIPLHLVTPQKWKKYLGANSDKDRSNKLCEGIFPNVNLIYPRCSTKHDGTAEALLIAEYGRRLKL